MVSTRRFFQLFPPPRYLSIPAAGLSFSSSSVRFAELDQAGDYLKLLRYGEEPIPRGALSEDLVADPNALRAVLSRMRRKYGLSFVRFALPERQSYLVGLQLPPMKRREMRGSIELQLEEYVPIPPREAVFDYRLPPCRAVRGSAHGHNEAGVSVVPRSAVLSYLALFEGTGLFPLSFELEAQALARALIRGGDCGTYMIADIGWNKTGISIVSRGIVRFTWTVGIGGEALTRAVAEALGIPDDEAKGRKEKEGLLYAGETEDGLYDVLEPPLSALSAEISKRSIYWQTHAVEDGKEERDAIAKIILCGGEANVPGIAGFIAGKTKSSVALGNPWTNIASFEDYIPEISMSESLRFTTALGLALRSARKGLRA